MFKNRQGAADKRTRKHPSLTSEERINGWVRSDSSAENSKSAGHSASPALLLTSRRTKKPSFSAFPMGDPQKCLDFMKSYLEQNGAVRVARVKSAAVASLREASKDENVVMTSPARTRPARDHAPSPKKEPTKNALPPEQSAAAAAKAIAGTPGQTLHAAPSFSEDSSTSIVVLPERRPSLSPARPLSMFPFQEHQTPQAPPPQAQLSAQRTVERSPAPTAAFSLTHVPGQVTQVVSLSLQTSGISLPSAAPQADLQLENQRLKAMIIQIQDTLQRLETRLAEVQPYSQTQKEQLEMISHNKKLRIFFTQLIAHLNSNVSACLSLTSERIGYSSDKNDILDGSSALVSAVPLSGFVTGPVKVAQITRMRHKSRAFGEIGQNYFFSISSMEIANTIFAIEVATRHIKHLQHMTYEGIATFAEFIGEKLLLPAWRDKKLTAGRLHLLPTQRALMIKEWLEYVYSREAPSMRIKHTDIELGKGLPYEWTAEEILFCSQVEIAGKTYGNDSRRAKFLTRKGDPAEIAALKLVEVSSSSPVSQQSPVRLQEYESKSNEPSPQAGAQAVRARSQSCSPAPQSQHPATLFSQRSATPTSHSRAGSGSYTPAEITHRTPQVDKKPTRPKRSHSRDSSRMFTSAEAALIKAEGMSLHPAAAAAAAPQDNPSAIGHNAKSRMFTPAKSIQVAEKGEGATHHRRTSSTYDLPTFSSQSRQVVSS